MKGVLDFLIAAKQLTEKPRAGWVARRVQSPETTAEHMFRVAFMAYILGSKKGLRLKNCLKEAVLSDFPETKRGSDDFLRAKNSLAKLTAPLREDLQREITLRWLESEKEISKEGKFVAQLDLVENLIQALEYLGSGGSRDFLEFAEKKVDDPLLKNFLEVIKKKFYGAKSAKKQKELKNILEFLLQVGKLKRMGRLYWKLRNIKNPETVADHIYTLTLAAWLLAAGRKELSLEKLLKMSLCHELSAVYTGDTTPYDRILREGGTEKREEILKRVIRLSKKEKESIFIQDYKQEKRSLEKLVHSLAPHLAKEIIKLWQEYRTKSSQEGRFLSQLNVAVMLLQGLIYEKKYDNFSAAPLWELAFEISDHTLILKFLDEMKQKFYT
ncbi:MAG: putative hydrolases of HD superfamily [Parcubacteria group bacterium Gr01-1014_30]|nr:MAG: putative hydrolases of HD superfamily [Parcubacteria group bacterium Gr01-1014_30]